MYKLANFTIIFLIGLYTNLLIYTGNIGLYINPRYFQLSEIASIVSLFVGSVGILYALKNLKFKLGFVNLKNVFVDYLPFVVFLIFAFGFAPATLSADLANNRSSQAGLLDTIQEETIFDSFQKNDQNFNILDWNKQIARSGNIQEFVGRSVNVVGFVYREAEDFDQFRIGRFIIRCCIVDATPVSLVVKSEDAYKFEDNIWVNVKGKFVEDDGLLKIEASEITEVEKPDSPYFY